MNKLKEMFEKWWKEDGVHTSPGSDPIYSDDWYEMTRDVYSQGWRDCRASLVSETFSPE